MSKEIEEGDVVKVSRYGKEQGIRLPCGIEKAGVNKIKRNCGLVKIEYYSPKSGFKYYCWYAKEFLEDVEATQK